MELLGANVLNQIRRPSFGTFSKTDATEIGNRGFVHIVCVKDDKVGSEISLVLTCLQENAKVGIKKVMARIFVRDPFNPICFSEDAEK